MVLFHAGFSWFEGGYVGVDIFLVISGFLITSIILKEKNRNKFSLSDFYLRRIRRIIPALFLVILFTIPFSIYFMNSNDLKLYSKSVLSVILFVSNFHFWKKGGYFGTESDLEPLLHTWSLGIEEQFYIFFPIFLIIIWKFKKNYLIPIIILFLLASLLLSQIGGNFQLTNLKLNYPFFKLPFEWFWPSSLANFYLPFGRVWELMIGSLIAFYFENNEIEENYANNFYCSLGIFSIIFSVIYFSENIQYPSFFALLPTLGTALVIIFTTKNTYLNKILSNKIIVNLGLISYSLYLWHQPIFAFGRIYFLSNLNLFISFLFIILSLILSYFSWKFVEQPFRNKNKIPNNKLLIYFISTFLIILSLSTLLFYNKFSLNKTFLPKKISSSMESVKKNSCFDIKFAHLNNTKNWFCEIGNKDKKDISFILFGDSHALALKQLMDEAAQEVKDKGIIAGYSGCIPFMDIYSIRPDQKEYNCKELNIKVFNFVKSKKIKKIFLAARWTYYTDGNYDFTQISYISKVNKLSSNRKNSRKAFEHGLSETIKKYNQIGTKIFLIHQVPLQIFTPKYIYLNSIKKNEKNYGKFLYNLSVDYDKHISFQSFARNSFNMARQKKLIKEINFDSFFCNKKKCIVGTEKGSYYSDDDHLSIFGSIKLKDEIKKFLN